MNKGSSKQSYKRIYRVLGGMPSLNYYAALVIHTYVGLRHNTKGGILSCHNLKQLLYKQQVCLFYFSFY